MPLPALIVLTLLLRFSFLFLNMILAQYMLFLGPCKAFPQHLNFSSFWGMSDAALDGFVEPSAPLL